MSMTVKTIPRHNVLHVFAAGTFSLDEAKRTFQEVIESIEANQSQRVLFDGRAVVGDPTIIERFYYGEYVASAVAARRRNENSGKNTAPQFAYVLLEPVLDPLRLGETVAVNRGMNVKAFDNLDEAVEWLGLVPEDIRDLHQTPDAKQSSN